MYPEQLLRLIEVFKQLPGVGQKTAQRYALTMLDMELEAVSDFASALIEAKDKIHPCQRCGHFTNTDLCSICLDASRDQTSICVVSSPIDILAIEKLDQYHGLYHVLGGLISATQNKMPDDLTIDELVNRVDEDVKEVILAFSPTLDGETTALYITNRLENKTNISSLAQGLPMGGQLEYADEMTLWRSFENRKKL